MKTYLTPGEFVALFWRFYESRMNTEFNPETSDKIIWSMFQSYETDIKETLEGSMWGIEEFTGEKASELIGYQFHKSFRQTDVIPAKHIDMILWTCIQDAPIFWKCMDRACKVLVSSDAAEIYKDEVW